jgi:hypothetical protein
MIGGPDDYVAAWVRAKGTSSQRRPHTTQGGPNPGGTRAEGDGPAGDRSPDPTPR